MLYLISYDLLKPGQNYDGLSAALKQAGARRVLLSQWALRSSSTATQIRDYLRQFIDAGDRLIVTQVATWAAWNAMADMNTI